MKRYTIDDAAKTLGIDTETLGRWLSSAHLAAFPEPGSHEYVLDQQQLDQLGGQEGLQVRGVAGWEGGQETLPRLQQGEGGSGVPTMLLQQGKAENAW